jgi:hypothetical protein
MIKPPVVYVVGSFRSLGAGLTRDTAGIVVPALSAMGQVPFFPPTVAGWEGGLSWLNTNTALARFDFAADLAATQKIDDVSGETSTLAFDRAWAAVGSPWLAPATRDALRAYAAKTFKTKRQRQVALRALILAGPDGQVM